MSKDCPPVEGSVTAGIDTVVSTPDRLVLADSA